MKVQRNLIPIKLHYFLRFSATTALDLYLPLIARQKGISPQGIGILWTTLPFIALVTNGICGAIADAFKIYRAMFLTGLILLTIGMSGVYFVPAINNESTKLTSNASVIMPMEIPLSDETNSDVGNFVMETRNNLNVLLSDDAYSDTGGNPSTEKESSLVVTLQTLTFWLLFICVLTKYIGIGITIIFSDATCLKILGSKHEDYGKQRMWGTIGSGIFSITIGALVDWYSKRISTKEYLPAFVFCIFLMTLDIILVSKMSIPSCKGEKLNFEALGNVLGSSRTVIFLLTVVLIGFTCGINWTFRMMLVEDSAYEFDPNFPSLHLLQGFMMFIGTFSELPFLFLSGCIIKRLGHETVFIICLLSVFLRYILYFSFSNPWWFLPVELLNGPGYGLIYANMISYGTLLAPRGALATVYSVINASFSAGQSTGGLMGGVLYHKIGGRKTFFTLSLTMLAFSLLYAISQLFLNCLCPKQQIQDPYVQSEEKNAPGPLSESLLEMKVLE